MSDSLVRLGKNFKERFLKTNFLKMHEIYVTRQCCNSFALYSSLFERSLASTLRTYEVSPSFAHELIEVNDAL